MSTAANCAICAKHQGLGPLAGPIVWEDELVVVTHRPAGDPGGRGVAGYLFVESRRHVDRWQLLTRAEMGAVAEAAWTGARVLSARFATEYVFTMIVGMAVQHFHQHVFVRHPGTPTDIAWSDWGTWPGAPRVPAADLEQLVVELAAGWEDARAGDEDDVPGDGPG
ncbi:histidine triad (HIT) protein [Kineococcus glutinatus]|uniref:HIT family protein n=1 Tax=Kineococcus glutinatus TaxID=1070872 RepID=UPI0031F03DA9